MAPERAASALIVPVPALEHAVGRSCRRVDAAAAVGVPAHATVLFPFAPEPDDETLARLREVVAEQAAFTSTWGRTGWFGEDVVFVEPDDPRPFIALTRAVEHAFPDHPAYGGAFDEVHPHVTIGHGHEVSLLREAEADVVPHLPVRQRVTAVELWVGGTRDGVPTGIWSRRHVLPLG